MHYTIRQHRIPPPLFSPQRDSRLLLTHTHTNSAHYMTNPSLTACVHVLSLSRPVPATNRPSVATALECRAQTSAGGIILNFPCRPLVLSDLARTRTVAQRASGVVSRQFRAVLARGSSSALGLLSRQLDFAPFKCHAGRKRFCQ